MNSEMSDEDSNEIMDTNENNELKSNELENKMSYNDNSEEDESSSDSDEDEEEKYKAMIKYVKEKIAENPYEYDNHLSLIEACKVAGDFDELSLARNEMAKVYPLTPQLWLDWINDEIKYFSDGSNDIKVLELFENAKKDYVSFEVGLKYQEFCLNLKNKDLVFKRSICEEIIESIGMHPILGHEVWENYRKFEEDNLKNNDNKSEFLDKIFLLYKKQLSIPSIKLDETFESFKSFIDQLSKNYPNYKYDIADIEIIYKNSKEEWTKIKKYENDLNTKDNLPSYYKYIEFELKQKNFNRIKLIFERAITEHCLDPELWLKYLNYLKENVENYLVLKNLLIRATRNVPWSSVIWIEYIKISEKFEIKDELIQKIFEDALESSFQTSEEYRNLWTSYLDFRKRKTNFKDEKSIEKLRKNFEVGIDHMSKIFLGDYYLSLPMYLAKIEAKFCSNIIKAREIWNEILNDYKGFNKDIMYWLEFAELEKYYGDNENYKKVMLRAIKNCPEAFSLLQNKLLKHFREETNDLIEIEKVEQSIKKVYDKIAVQIESSEKNSKKNSKRKDYSSENQQKNVKKTKTEDDKSKIKRDKDGFVIPQTIASSQQRPEFKKPDSDTNVLQTVIVKNLSFDLDEREIEKIFEKFGKIQEVRLVRKFNGKSKGYCYIEYTSIEDAKNAVKNDRYLIDGRPAFINEINSNLEFKYKTELEKNKLFISNLSPKTNEAKLKEIFSKYEGFKELRLSNYRNGHSKCIAYVEFNKDNNASKALLQSDNLEIDGKRISVAISNPPKKKEVLDLPTKKALGEGFAPKKNFKSGKQRLKF